MRLLSLPLLLWTACTIDSSKDSGETTEVVDHTADLEATANKVQAFVDEWNNSDGTPWDITDDSITGYAVATDGTTSLGTLSNNYYGYLFNPPDLYAGTDHDLPEHSTFGVEDDSYDPDSATGIEASLLSFMLVGNGEGHKTTGSAETFNEGARVGSLDFILSTIDSDKEACRPGSFVRNFSDEALAYSPWYGAMAELTDQIPTDQLAYDWWPPYSPEIDPYISETYWRNVAGPYQSHPWDDGVMKQEFGEVAQVATYDSRMSLGVLPDSFVEANPNICLRISESDKPVGGATGFNQTQLPINRIMEELRNNGLPESFRVISAHEIDNEQVIYQAYCQTDADAPLSDLIPIPEITLSEGEIWDVSESLCTNPDQANMSKAELLLKRKS